MVSLLKSRAGLIVVAGTIALLCSPKFRNKVFKASKQISDTLFMNDNKESSPSDDRGQVETAVTKSVGNNVIYFPSAKERIKTAYHHINGNYNN